ncbi:hypothetical protein Dtox_1992 [Desulfofarcimen acetoxidans DSM 771]|uniref:Uncharacterized protein n=1 Tax=Desulfofarcimen acetoxidans (strain ATCC 49208 / DSM 771 / KCTC 5769 / VKM B-1644 / 5575) TaxID=485916 RepID=C8VYE6_DESAS|nr:hypothetical protein [Desulfofarcimen acetoxidans]ACV62827.1 hypothetical protein Dtox_1992 [Desulfofarcimen acetoxidans DSM 771]
MTKAKDMNQAQIAHTFCSWCNYRLFVAGYDYWGCKMDEKKKDEECLYKLAIQKDEKNH